MKTWKAIEVDYFEAAKHILRKHAEPCTTASDLMTHVRTCEPCRTKIINFVKTWDEFKKITDGITTTAQDWEHA